MTRRTASPFLALLALLIALVLTVSCSSSPPPAASGASPTEADQGEAPTSEGTPVEGEPGSEEGKGGNLEAAEQAETTDKRLEAAAEARANGTLGVDPTSLVSSPAAGWAGEYVVDRRADDWEPAVATVLQCAVRLRRHDSLRRPEAVQGQLPHTLDGAHDLEGRRCELGFAGAPVRLQGQRPIRPADPVVPDNGNVYAAFMNGYNVVFIRSTDHGKTWSAPVKTYGNVSWNDKPILVTSDDGRDVYIAFNGPQGGDPWITQSHDGGLDVDPDKALEGRSVLLRVRRRRHLERAGGVL